MASRLVHTQEIVGSIPIRANFGGENTRVAAKLIYMKFTAVYKNLINLLKFADYEWLLRTQVGLKLILNHTRVLKRTGHPIL